MNVFFMKLSGSFAAGTAATAGLIRLIYWAPLPSYMKIALAVAVPIPSIAAALVLVNYGGGTAVREMELAGNPRELLNFFLYGCLVSFACALMAAAWRSFRRAHSTTDD